MPSQNDFFAFAGGVGANVESQADWAAEPSVVSNGFPSGILRGSQLNKSLRQPSFVSHVVSQYMADVLAAHVADDGLSGNYYVQLYEALLVGGAFNDVGAQNALLTVNPFGLVFPAPIPGLRISVYAATNNSAATTFNWMGTGNFPVTLVGGSACRGGEILKNNYYTLIFTGTNTWQIMSPIQPAIPVAGLTAYIRTDGNDNNDGTANTAGSAFATIAGALNILSTRFGLLPNRTLTLVLGLAGTYSNAGIAIPFGASVLIKGNTSTAASYIISGGTGQDVISPNGSGVNLFLQDLTVNNNNTTQNWVSPSAGATLNLTNVNFTRTGGTNNFFCINSFPGATIYVNNVTFTSIASAGAIFAHGGGNITVSPTNTAVLTFAGANTFSSGTGVASDCGILTLGILSVVGGGTVTGQRYQVLSNGVIETEGQGTSIFPGTIAGSTTTGGQYIP